MVIHEPTRSVIALVICAVPLFIGCGQKDGAEEGNAATQPSDGGEKPADTGTVGSPDGGSAEPMDAADTSDSRVQPSPANGDGSDAGDTSDAGTTDAASPIDAGGVADAGEPGTSDAAPSVDAGGVADAGEPGTSDAAPSVDAGGVADAGEPGTGDAAPSVDADSALDASDAASDAGPAADGSAPWPDDRYISIDEVYQRLQNADPDMLLVNVVDEEFYDLGHIEGSLTIPWDTLSGNLDQLDPDMHIVIYCRRGVRSESAYDTLAGNGYPQVWVMDGGIEAWIAAGYATVPY
jgi:rhodanese-related sulfurtransferase